MKKAIIGLLGVAIVLTMAFFVTRMDNEEEAGSVNRANEYHYVHYSGSGIATTSLIATGQGAFGSVIITEDQAGAVWIYDATSTEAIGTGFEETIATFENAQAEGVYTFDVAYRQGLVFVSADGYVFAGNWTITYR